jgi:hypothetical protein
MKFEKCTIRKNDKVKVLADDLVIFATPVVISEEVIEQ